MHNYGKKYGEIICYDILTSLCPRRRLIQALKYIELSFFSRSQIYFRKRLRSFEISKKREKEEKGKGGQKKTRQERVHPYGVRYILMPRRQPLFSTLLEAISSVAVARMTPSVSVLEP